jgi:hypothetical protein
MPAKRRGRRDDCRDFAQRASTEPVRPRGESTSVVLGEPQAPPADLPPQHPILFDQVREHLSLSEVQPAGDREEQHSERRDVDHEPELTSTAEVPALTIRSAETWDTSVSGISVALP